MVSIKYNVVKGHPVIQWAIKYYSTVFKADSSIKLYTLYTFIIIIRILRKQYLFIFVKIIPSLFFSTICLSKSLIHNLYLLHTHILLLLVFRKTTISLNCLLFSIKIIRYVKLIHVIFILIIIIMIFLNNLIRFSNSRASHIRISGPHIHSFIRSI